MLLEGNLQSNWLVIAWCLREPPSCGWWSIEMHKALRRVGNNRRLTFRDRAKLFKDFTRD